MTQTAAPGTPLTHRAQLVGCTLEPAAVCHTCDWSVTGLTLGHATVEAGMHTMLPTTAAERAQHWRQAAAMDALAAAMSRP